jgi:hypothetical protein
MLPLSKEKDRPELVYPSTAAGSRAAGWHTAAVFVWG